MRIGWLGLGAMGGPMAACLARAGHSVSAYDVVPGRAPAGVTEAASIADAVAGADVVAVMVATPEQLEHVFFTEKGAASTLADGQIVVGMSTGGPEAVGAAASRLGAAGGGGGGAPGGGGGGP